VAKDVRVIEDPAPDEELRVDGEPAAPAELEHVAVVQVAVQHDPPALTDRIVEQPTRDSRGPGRVSPGAVLAAVVVWEENPRDQPLCVDGLPDSSPVWWRLLRKLGRVMRIRLYEPRDRADIADICVRTGDNGQDATGHHSSDDLLPDIYALPYVDYEPELVFVVDNGERVVGYILGAADTRAFAEWFSAEWWPAVAGRYSGNEALERAVVASAANPQRMLIAAVDEYPAHLHIDLLPEAQGQGLGRRLIETFAAALADRDVPGLHLVVGTGNTSARAFYRRVGFAELASDSGGVVMGMKIA
jgi:ribosomal protein S18 acetylase RimI-like enzyme